MKLKRYTNFLNESQDKKILLKFMNNEDRRSILDLYNMLIKDKDESLPDYLNRFEGDVFDKIASYIYNPFKHKDLLSKYIYEEGNTFTLLDLIQEQSMDWDDRNITSEEFIEEATYNLRGELIDAGVMNGQLDSVYILTPEEEAALPSNITIQKYNL